MSTSNWTGPGKIFEDRERAEESHFAHVKDAEALAAIRAEATVDADGNPDMRGAVERLAAKRAAAKENGGMGGVG